MIQWKSRTIYDNGQWKLQSWASSEMNTYQVVIVVVAFFNNVMIFEFFLAL